MIISRGNPGVEITKDMEQKIAGIGKKYKLRLAVIYGSYAKDKSHKASDLDIAVLGKKELDFKTVLELYSEFSDVFRGKEIDIKSLHRVDPFFRYQVMRDSILIYGEPLEYHNFKAYAFRAYMDSRDLLRLEQIMSQKTISYLRESHA